MTEATGLAVQLSIMAVLTGVMECLLPSGRLKRTASYAAGVTFLSAAVEKILGIIVQWGV